MIYFGSINFNLSFYFGFRYVWLFPLFLFYIFYYFRLKRRERQLSDTGCPVIKDSLSDTTEYVSVPIFIYRQNKSGFRKFQVFFNPLNAELNPICHLLALLGVHFVHVSRIRVKSLNLRLLVSYIYIYIYIYGAPILDVSRSHTTTQHSR